MNRSRFAFRPAAVLTMALVWMLLWGSFSPVAFGQLGFGKDGVKSSHTANKMDVGEGLVARQVVASVGQTHLLVDTETVKGVETWEPPTEPLPRPSLTGCPLSCLLGLGRPGLCTATAVFPCLRRQVGPQLGGHRVLGCRRLRRRRDARGAAAVVVPAIHPA